MYCCTTVRVSVPTSISALGRVDAKKEYLYYTTVSSNSPYNPLYRLDIASRETHGEHAQDGVREGRREGKHSVHH